MNAWHTERNRRAGLKEKRIGYRYLRGITGREEKQEKEKEEKRREEREEEERERRRTEERAIGGGCKQVARNSIPRKPRLIKTQA